MSTYEIISETTLGRLTVWTVRQLPSGFNPKIWTLVAHADGTNVVIDPAGAHHKYNGERELSHEVEDFMNWVSHTI
jgi:hypothetical protein